MENLQLQFFSIHHHGRVNVRRENVRRVKVLAPLLRVHEQLAPLLRVHEQLALLHLQLSLLYLYLIPQVSLLRHCYDVL